jgi:hypothetical protein
LCDADEEAINDMVNEELDIDSDFEMELEIEGETGSEEPKAFIGLIINMGLIPLPTVKDCWSNEWAEQITLFGDVISRDHFLVMFWMLHVGNDATKESSRPFKRTERVHGVTEHTEKQFQKYVVLGKSTAIDESAVG